MEAVAVDMPGVLHTLNDDDMGGGDILPVIFKRAIFRGLRSVRIKILERCVKLSDRKIAVVCDILKLYGFSDEEIDAVSNDGVSLDKSRVNVSELDEPMVLALEEEFKALSVQLRELEDWNQELERLQQLVESGKEQESEC